MAGLYAQINAHHGTGMAETPAKRNSARLSISPKGIREQGGSSFLYPVSAPNFVQPCFLECPPLVRAPASCPATAAVVSASSPRLAACRTALPKSAVLATHQSAASSVWATYPELPIWLHFLRAHDAKQSPGFSRHRVRSEPLGPLYRGRPRDRSAIMSAYTRTRRRLGGSWVVLLCRLAISLRLSVSFQKRIGTGARRMREPCPADCGSTDPAYGFLSCCHRFNAEEVVIPISKQPRPLPNFLPRPATERNGS